MHPPVVESRISQRIKLFSAGDQSLSAEIETTTKVGGDKDATKEKRVYLRADGLVWITSKKKERRVFRIRVAHEFVRAFKAGVDALSKELPSLEKESGEEKHIETTIESRVRIGLRKKLSPDFIPFVVISEESVYMWIDLEHTNGLAEIHDELARALASLK